jgi:hypothetical protein
MFVPVVGGHRRLGGESTRLPSMQNRCTKMLHAQVAHIRHHVLHRSPCMRSAAVKLSWFILMCLALLGLQLK